MTRLPRTSGKEVVGALERAGFEVQRVRGSHLYLSTPMEELHPYRCIPVKRSAQV